MVSGNRNNSHYNAIEQDSNHCHEGAGISYTTRSEMTDDSGSEISREATWQ